ncbi:hypothetical protein [Pedobacter xixiisoli]|uniref:F5/8 type C domain-containing protein n=1 Tax=Pedobacter xixiisoli TaxID=1476464 RepID=A0A286A8K3_9SPHI|nr:hypothetical protein [Pedobacter xixiisoli]SOD18212.1 hypothetical protein SAMN06297358_2884 [Pedobacter xixiisoli]
MLKISLSRSLAALLCLVASLGIQKTNAQLVAGDILFTGLDSQPGIAATGPRFDRVSFIAMREIPANTVIYFTDRGYKAGTWFPANANTEGSVKFTVTTKINPKDEVLLILTPAFYDALVAGASVGTVQQEVSRLSLGNSGDQLFAYHSSNGQPNGPGAVLIAGLHWNYTSVTNDAGWDNLTTGSNPMLSTVNSDIPPGLVGGQSAFWIGTTASASTESGSFNGAGKPYGSLAQIRVAVLNRSNWTRYDFGNGSANATVPTNHFFDALPVTLTDFSATLKNGILKATWKTQSEISNSHFIVQSSTDGNTWKDIATKNAVPNATSGASYELEASIETMSLAGFGLLGLLLLPLTKKRYRIMALLLFASWFVSSCAKENADEDGFFDNKPKSHRNIYIRLAQVDLNGTITYSNVVNLKID